MKQPDFKPIYLNGQLDDIEAIGEKSYRMLGAAGQERELAPARDFLEKNRHKLPVFLGLGLGYGLKKLLDEYDGPIAVIDKEKRLQELAQLPASLTQKETERIFFIDEDNSAKVLDRLTQWQEKNSGKAFYPITNAFYLRLDRDYYGQIRQSLLASSSFDFWSKAKLPRFRNEKPRVLLLASKYFLVGELIRACEKLEIPHKLIQVQEESNGQQFVKTLLEEAVSFKPDCAITLNHMGVDREGLLTDLFSKLELPLASWFVDNPHLILHLYNKCISPWTTIFTWDEDNLPSLKKLGFEHAHYLPLGTDINRFNPANHAGKPEWRSRISFVGNSMLYKVGQRLKTGHFPKQLLTPFKKIAQAFSQADDRSVAEFLASNFPDAASHYLALQDNEARLNYEAAITWQATKVYRNNCVRQLLPFKPLIVGDTGWKIEFRHNSPQPRFLDAISYYDELPYFYGMSEINFNCTSKQMKGAVNQRVFDAPAAGAFVLSDWRPQLANLFEPDEIAYFTEPGEIPSLCDFYLRNSKARREIIAKARKRVVAHHKWDDRLQELLAVMRQIYGVPAAK